MSKYFAKNANNVYIVSVISTSSVDSMDRAHTID